MNHALQLRFAFDRGSVHAQNDVVLFDASFAGGSILVNHGHFNTLLLFQLQGAEPVGADIHDVHTQIGTRARILAGNAEGLGRIDGPALLRGRQTKQQRQQCDRG